jgi:hypothetical protein
MTETEKFIKSFEDLGDLTFGELIQTIRGEVRSTLSMEYEGSFDEFTE